MGQTLAEDHCQAAGAPLPDSDIVQEGMCGPNLVGASAGYTRCPLWDSSIAGGGRAGRMGRGQGLYTQGWKRGLCTQEEAVGSPTTRAFQAGRLECCGALQNCAAWGRAR